MIPKHEPPRTCRWRLALFGASPSATLSTCRLGLRQTRKACKGCEMNVAELMQEGFAEGLRRGEPLNVKVIRTERPIQRFYAGCSDFIHPEEGLTAAHKRYLMQRCACKMVDDMINAGAFYFQASPGEGVGPLSRRIECRAVLEVVMPDKEEEEEDSDT